MLQVVALCITLYYFLPYNSTVILLDIHNKQIGILSD